MVHTKRTVCMSGRGGGWLPCSCCHKYASNYMHHPVQLMHHFLPDSSVHVTEPALSRYTLLLTAV